MGWVAVLATAAACGETRDVLTSRDGGTSADGRAGREGGVGGIGGANENAGGNAGQNEGAAGGAGANGEAGTLALADGGETLLDPHAAERRALAEQLCAPLAEYPCLDGPEIGLGSMGSIGISGENHDPTSCAQAVELDGYIRPPECWDEWVKTTKCLISEPHHCPCVGQACVIEEPGVFQLLPDGGAPCFNDQLNACWSAAKYGSGSVTGTRLDCNWYVNPDKTSCQVDCNADPSSFFVAECQGLPGGPYSCRVSLNDRELIDDISGGEAYFIVPDCPSIATAMANGRDGVNFVDCCISWQSADPPSSRCSCTPDPTQAGFSSCAAAAAAGGGEVVDLCPQYEPSIRTTIGQNFPSP